MATGGQTEYWSEEYVEYRCVPCESNKKVKNADKYCFDCLKYLCDSCLSIHNTLITTHQVLPLSGDTIKKIVTEKCEKHPNEVVQYFCRQHDALLCKICQEKDHKLLYRNCQHPQNIRESSDELNALPELQAVPAQLKSALDNINKVIIALDEHMANIKKNGNSFLKDLEVYAKKLLSRIEELKEKGKNDINRKQEELLAVAKHHRQACALTKDEINQCLDRITKSKEWKANTFVLKKKGQTIAQKFDAIYNKSDKLIQGHKFNVMTEMKIFDSLNCVHSLVKENSTKVQDISSQGAVGGEVYTPVQEIVSSPAEPQVGRSVEKQGDRPVVKPEKKQINVRIPGNKNICSNTGFCHLSDGSLVVADFNNSRLMCVDPSSSRVTIYCYTDKQPLDVCCIGPQEVAVAFSGSTQVFVYNTVSLTRTRTVKLGHKTAFIACHGGLLYCAVWPGDILYVHDVSSGRKLKEISKDTDGRELFSAIRHIAVTGSGDRVYVVDGERGLVCVGTDGRRIFHLSEEDLRLSKAWGVTTDHHGHVFVCGADSHNVVKVTEDGHVVCQILSKEDRVESPFCLSYDVSRNYLYVGGKSDQLLMVEWK